MTELRNRCGACGHPVVESFGLKKSHEPDCPLMVPAREMRSGKAARRVVDWRLPPAEAYVERLGRSG